MILKIIFSNLHSSGWVFGVSAPDCRSSEPSSIRKKKFCWTQSAETWGAWYSHQQESYSGKHWKVGKLSFISPWGGLIAYIINDRSETLAIPEKSRSRRQSYRGSPRRNRRMSGGSYRAITDDDSFGLGTDVSIDFEELSSPILERPTTLPEMNSRPASRVMKSFSCDEVRELEIWNINIRFSDIRLHKRNWSIHFIFATIWKHSLWSFLFCSL